MKTATNVSPTRRALLGGIALGTAAALLPKAARANVEPSFIAR